MSRFQKYRLNKKTEFQNLKRFEKLAKEYFPQIWEFFEILEETTITNFQQTGPTVSTEEERPVTAVTNFDQTGPTASTGEEETIDRLIEEVYQSKDSIFNIEDILDEIYDL